MRKGAIVVSLRVSCVINICIYSGYTAHAVIDAVVKSARGIGVEGRKKKKKRLAAEAAAKGGAPVPTGPAAQTPAKTLKPNKTDTSGGPPAGVAIEGGNNADDDEGDEDWLVGEVSSSLKHTGLLDCSLELVLPLIDNELFGEEMTPSIFSFSWDKSTLFC